MKPMAQDYYVTPSPQASQISKKTVLIGGGLVLALILGVVMLTSGGNGTSTQLQHLSLRLTALQALLEDPNVRTNLKDQELLQITSELKLSLTTSQNELAPLLISAGMPPKFDGGIVATETLQQKIVSLRALTAETFRAVKNQKLKAGLVNLDKNLNSAKKRLDKLSF